MRGGAAALLVALSTATHAVADMRVERLTWSDLKGWSADSHAEALDTFLGSCGAISFSGWEEVCALGRKVGDGDKAARTFFETNFVPVLLTDGAEPLFTGYYEPEFRGSPRQTAEFQWPIYAMPPDLPRGKPWHTRREIEERGLLRGRGLEIAWLADPMDVFQLQVQGSGRIDLGNGKTVRVGFAAKNGHPYRSVGKELARRGIFEAHMVSASVIRKWVRKNPEEGRQMLWHNPSFVFFRKVTDLDAKEGPLGAMNRPLTALRSLAVDPKRVPLGAPVWIEKDGKSPLRRLMVAQDTGSAIKGAQRGDIFYGTGEKAGRTAGRIRDGGRLVVLYPVALARRYLSAPTAE